MTLILACSWGGKTAIASDSHGADDRVHRDYGKKWERLPFGAVGWSGSYEWFPAVRKGLRQIPRLRTEADHCAFREAMEAGLVARGWKRESANGLPTCGSVLGVVVSNEGRCWELYSGLILYPCAHIAAAGCGDVAGIAASEALRRRRVNAYEACQEAVRIAIGMVPGVKGRVHLLRVK